MLRQIVSKIIVHSSILIVFWSVAPANAHAEHRGEKPVNLEAGLYYTIQKGDTLWDLSEHFYDSPWVWPDLWQKNKEVPILNPHWIYPGQRIRIFSRKQLETMVEPPEPLLEAKAEMAFEPPEPPYYAYPAINRVGFIRKKPVSPCGAIFKVKEGKVMISKRDLVYIRPVGNVTFKPGDRFTVFRTLKPVKDQETKGLIGVQHYLLGVVEITEVQPKFSIGKIIQSFRHIEVGDMLMPYEPRSPKIILAESKKGLNGKVLVSEENQSIFGDQAVVFVDKGRKDGIKVGQSYSIYYQDKEYLDPKGKEEVLLSPVDFAKILILHTEETTATALVTMADKDIEPGAKLRTPPL